jgi:hypothetical protein
MTRRIATLPNISTRPNTRSSKGMIRQKDGDGAISTRSFWTYLTAPRLSSVRFRGITDAMPSTGKAAITRKTPLLEAALRKRFVHAVGESLPGGEALMV